MTQTELLVTFILLPSAATIGLLMPRRGESIGRSIAQALLLLALLVLLARAWVAVEMARTSLLVLPFAVTAAARWKGVVRDVVAVFGGLSLLALIAFAVGSPFAFVAPHPIPGGVSPDGKWELTYAEERDSPSGGVLRIAPRGLATLDPRAYPSRELVDFVFVTNLVSARWTGPREIEIAINRISDGGPVVRDGSGFRVTVLEP